MCDMPEAPNKSSRKELKKRQVPMRLTNYEYLADTPYFDILIHNVYTVWPLHWHEFYEVELILSGEGTHFINGKESILSKGIMYLLTPADFHEVRPLEGKTLEILNVKFAEGMLNDKLLPLLFSGNSVLVAEFTGESYDRIYYELIRLLEEHGNPKKGSAFVIKGGLERVLIDLFRRSSTDTGHINTTLHKTSLHNTVVHNSEEYILKSLTYINHHFREDITLHMMASKAHLTANYFSEKFHNVTGMSFQNFLLNMRLGYARSLLSTTSMTVSEICFTSGFNSVPYFNRVFKKHFGQSPNSYRRIKC